MRIGVIGSGWVAANRYLPVLARLNGVEIVGIADHHAGRAQAIAESYGSPAYTDGEALLDAGPEVVFICTPPFSHASLTVAALEHGAHVFVEKPMAVTLSDAQRMVSTAARTGMSLGVCHNFLFSRSMSTALKRIRTGRLGHIRHVHAVQASSPSRRLPVWYADLPGGLFFDEAPHMVYLIRALVGNLKVEHVWSRPDVKGDAIAALGVDFRGESGLPAELTMLFDAPVSEWLLMIICEQGVVVVDLFRDICFVIPPDGRHGPFEILRTSLAGISGHTIGTMRSGLRFVTRRQFWGHDVIIADFLSAVRDKRTPVITSEVGVQVVQVLSDVLAAAEKGTTPS